MALLDEPRRAALAAVADGFGTPCYVYDEAMIHERVALVRDAFDPRKTFS